MKLYFDISLIDLSKFQKNLFPLIQNINLSSIIIMTTLWDFTTKPFKFQLYFDNLIHKKFHKFKGFPCDKKFSNHWFLKASYIVRHYKIYRYNYQNKLPNYWRHFNCINLNTITQQILFWGQRNLILIYTFHLWIYFPSNIYFYNIQYDSFHYKHLRFVIRVLNKAFYNINILKSIQNF